MNFQFDKDTDEFCNDLLKEIAEIDRKLSKKITQRVKSIPAVKEHKNLRKLGKVAIVYEEHHALYERAVENLQALPKWYSTPPDSVVSVIYHNVYKMISETPYSGSVELKNEKKW
ncbi:MAG: hypothetical protein IIA77_00935 [Proteobacteria bacterium]|nr:hypothetical protein [Pseudomonadota bacterium]